MKRRTFFNIVAAQDVCYPETPCVTKPTYQNCTLRAKSVAIIYYRVKTLQSPTLGNSPIILNTLYLGSNAGSKSELSNQHLSYLKPGYLKSRSISQACKIDRFSETHCTTSPTTSSYSKNDYNPVVRTVWSLYIYLALGQRQPSCSCHFKHPANVRNKCSLRLRSNVNITTQHE